MRKFSWLLAITIVCTASAAKADNDWYFKPYGGIDYQHVGVDYKNVIPSISTSSVLNDSLNGFDIHAGARVNKYLGGEIGYLWTGEAGKNNVLGTGLNTTTQVTGWTFDALGYLPVTSDQKLELIATAGLTDLSADLKLNGAGGHASVSESEVGGRFGGGAQYWITDHVNGRVLVRYQTADFNGIANDAVEVNAGLNYQF
jgi:opacity protein-like surface antigen